MPLNPAILGWLALAAAPIIIHLLNRRRYRNIHWAAMQFLADSIAKSSRRLRIEQLIILALRMLILALIVYAMARPYLPGALPGVTARPKRNAVIILDRSLSMRYDEHRVSTFARAKEAVANIVGELESGDSVNLVLAGGKPQLLLPEPILDLNRVGELLADVEPCGNEANLPQAAEAALAQLDKSHNPLREIYVVTDRQAFGWHAESEGHWFAALAGLQRSSAKPRVHVLQVGAGQSENLAVTALAPAQGSIGIYHPARFDVRITNYGKEKRTALNVSFAVDDSREEVLQADVHPGEAVSVSFQHQFAEPGSHLARVRIDADALPADDEMMTSVEVLAEIPVLLVDGLPDRTALTPPGPLELALQPRDKDQPEFKTLLAAQVCRPDAIPELSTAKYHLVILHDVPRLTQRQASDLEHFVNAGGGLLVFPGPHTDASAFNTLLYRNTDGPLPAKMEAAPPLKQPARGMAQAFTNPALVPFRDPKNGDFTRIEVMRYFRLTPEPTDETSRVIARLDNGEPLIVEKLFGEGKVIQWAVPVDAAWTNLQKRSLFVPLAHYISYYLAGSVRPPLNVLLGSPVSRFLPLNCPDRQLKVVGPDEKEYDVATVQKEDHLVATFNGTDEAGVYRMIEPQGKVETFYVVRPPVQESNLAELNPRERVWVEENLGATFAKDWDELRGEVFARTKPLREFWQLLVATVIALILLETILTGRFSKRSQQGDDRTRRQPIPA